MRLAVGLAFRSSGDASRPAWHHRNIRVPSDPEARFCLLKAALVNFMSDGHGDGGSWPTRFEDTRLYRTGRSDAR